MSKEAASGPERTLDGRYRLIDVIGRGGMGVVYRAEDLRLGRTVAVKLMAQAPGEEDPLLDARFGREARATARLNHPGIVRVFDGRVSGDTRYIVMEHVHGESLDAILRRGPLEPARAAELAAQLADALAAAHAAGVVHRDIKPANVIVDADDRARLLDFGVARIAGDAALTRTASLIGTAGYMSPEQLRGDPVDARSDIYSLGCLLHAMLTGEPPFTAASAAAVIQQHLTQQPRAPSRRGAAVTPALDALVLAMLAKAPAARPQDAATVVSALRGSRSAGEPHTAPTLRMPPSPAAAAALPGSTPRRSRRRNLAVPVVLATVAAALIALALTAAAPTAPRRHRPPSTASTHDSAASTTDSATAGATTPARAGATGASGPAGPATAPPPPAMPVSTPAAGQRRQLPPGQARKGAAWLARHGPGRAGDGPGARHGKHAGDD